MAITINCECGKRLQAKDEFAGKRFKCPGCGTIQVIPVLEEAFAASPLKSSGSWEAGNEEAEERPVPVVRPGTKRGETYLADDDADEDRPAPKRKKKKARSSYNYLEKPVAPRRGGSFFSTNGGMVGGLVMMLIAVAWFFGGLLAGYIFFYPPILLIIGIVAFIKGLSN